MMATRLIQLKPVWSVRFVGSQRRERDGALRNGGGWVLVRPGRFIRALGFDSVAENIKDCISRWKDFTPVTSILIIHFIIAINIICIFINNNSNAYVNHFQHRENFWTVDNS